MLMGMMVMGSMGILHTTEVKAADTTERTYDETVEYYEEGNEPEFDENGEVTKYGDPSYRQETVHTGIYDVNNITAEDGNETVNIDTAGARVNLATSDANATLGTLSATNESLVNVVSDTSEEANNTATVQNVTVDSTSTLVLNGNTVVDALRNATITNDGVIQAINFDLLSYTNFVDYLQNYLNATLSGSGWYMTFDDTYTTTNENNEEYVNAMLYNTSLTRAYKNTYADAVGSVKQNNENVHTQGVPFFDMHVYYGATGTRTLSKLTIKESTKEAINNAIVDAYTIYTTVPVKDGYTQAQIDELTNSAIAAQQAEAQVAALQQYYTEVAIPQALNMYEYYEELGFKPVVCCGTMTVQQIADMYHISVEKLMQMNPIGTKGYTVDSYLPAYMVIVVG